MRKRPRWCDGALFFGLLLPCALVLLPACNLVFQATADEPPPVPDAIACEIEDRTVPRRCATAIDLQLARDGNEAAIDLVRRIDSTFRLDESQEARDRCAGQPEVVVFEDVAPTGELVCVNAAALPADGVKGGCVERCLAKNGSNPADAPVELREFCEAHARPSVNAFAPFLGQCANGVLLGDFEDPRYRPTPVTWMNLDGVMPAASDALIRTRMDTPQPSEFEGFDAGASSTQIIESGDAYVEFGAGNLGGARVVGLSQGAFDGGPDKNDVDFGVRLTMAGFILLSERGVLLENGPGDPVFGTYQADSRIRVRVTALPDRTHATVTYEQVVGPCDPNTFCQTVPLRAPSGPASYPFRVDSSFKEAGAEVVDVRIVYIR